MRLYHLLLYVFFRRKSNLSSSFTREESDDEDEEEDKDETESRAMSSQGGSELGSDFAPTPEPSDLPTNSRTQHTRKRKSSSKTPDTLEKELINLAKSEDDSDGKFGSYIAAELRKLDERDKDIAKLRIQEVLFQVKFPLPPVGRLNSGGYGEGLEMQYGTLQ